MPKLSLSVAVLLVTTLVSAVTTPVFADEPTVNSEVNALSLSQAFVMAAVRALKHIVQARTNLADWQGSDRPQERRQLLSDTQSELDRAQVLLQGIDELLPTTQVKNWLWIARKQLDYENPAKVVADLAPVYEELADLEDYLPVTASRRQVDKAKQALEKGDKKAAAEALEAASEVLVYPEMELPLTTSLKLIARAQADLASGRIQDAGATLAVADDSITALAMATATPLPQARLSLQQAAKNYADDAYETAKANVHRAIGALQRAAEKGDEKARQDLQYLLEQASQLQSKIDKKEASVSHELSHLVQWVQALSERAMEQLSSAWSELRHRNSPAQSDLIEAKLHLGYAEADQLTAGSFSGAKLLLISPRLTGYVRSFNN
jgi:hypothetical protein